MTGSVGPDPVKPLLLYGRPAGGQGSQPSAASADATVGAAERRATGGSTSSSLPACQWCRSPPDPTAPLVQPIDVRARRRRRYRQQRGAKTVSPRSARQPPADLSTMKCVRSQEATPGSWRRAERGHKCGLGVGLETCYLMDGNLLLPPPNRPPPVTCSLRAQNSTPADDLTSSGMPLQQLFLQPLGPAVGAASCSGTAALPSPDTVRIISSVQPGNRLPSKVAKQRRRGGCQLSPGSRGRWLVPLGKRSTAPAVSQM